MDPRLLSAAGRNHENRIRELVEEDSDILLGQTPEGNTALHLSARFGWVSSLETICELCPLSLLTCCNNKGQTALHSAALGRNRKAVITITTKIMNTNVDVEHGGGQDAMKEMMRMTDSNGDTALHLAIIRGYDEDVASELIDLDGEGLAEVENNRGESPLYLAALSGMSTIVERLLEFGPSNNTRSGPPPHNQTDTHAAAAIAGDTGTSCHHSHSRRAPGMHRTALHAAVISRDRDTTRKLLQKKSGMDKEVDGSGWIPLHYAAKSGDTRMVILLLHQDVSTGYYKDNNGNMAIHIAAQQGWRTTFRVIQSFCPDSVDAINEKGENVLHCTTRCLVDFVAETIVNMPELRLLINHQDNNGNTPLHLAILEGRFHGSFYKFSKTKALNPMILNNDGYTTYDLFCSRKTQFNYQELFKDFFENVLSKKYKFSFSLVHIGGATSSDRVERLQKYTSNSSVVATLMATITFAAAFTMPGGYSSGDGKVVLFRNAALKAFLISDTISMCCSLLAAFLFSSWSIYTKPVQFYENYAVVSPLLMKIAFWGMLVAFATGMYSVLAPNCMWLAILICILCSIVPFLNHFVEKAWDLISWMFQASIAMQLWLDSKKNPKPKKSYVTY